MGYEETGNSMNRHRKELFKWARRKVGLEWMKQHFMKKIAELEDSTVE